MLLFSRATRFRCAWLGLLLETEFFRMSCLVLEVGQFFWLNSTLMAVYSTTQIPSLVIVSVSLSCNVYFNSVRELELVVDVHEHLVSRGSFEAEVLVVGVIDDVLDQLSDRLSLEGCRRLKVWSLLQLFSMMVRVCPLPYFCLSSSEVPCGSSESQSVSSSFMSWFVLVRLHAIGVFSECFAMYFTFVEMLLLVWESKPVERSSMMMSVVSEFIDSRQPLYLFIYFQMPLQQYLLLHILQVSCVIVNVCYVFIYQFNWKEVVYIDIAVYRVLRIIENIIFVTYIIHKSIQLIFIKLLLFIEYYALLKILTKSNTELSFYKRIHYILKQKSSNINASKCILYYFINCHHILQRAGTELVAKQC
ncbi:Hypothetical_protein [Hexamita inflata]|uniref:Hypothetical_protein n=1 Tax=Hexamita inflata TaxID=28002 RepID=A0AA86Q3R6_9EUKA|nr:Hypothetical protein HINF_LOCUS36803 [Hexamita inflata]